MEVLVTGAGGFIGKNLVKKLCQEGYNVTSLVYREKPEEKKFLEEAGSKVLLGDVTDKSFVEGVTKGFDVVINLAAQRRGWTESENTSYNVNVLGTRYLVEDAIDNDVDHFVHCSTSSIIGTVQDQALDETSDKRDRSKIYYRTKLKGDKEVLSRKDQIPVTVVLPPLVYGPHDDHHLPLFEAVRDRKIHFIGGGNNLFQPTYIDDCVQGFLLCLLNEDAFGERFIIGNTEPRKTREIVYSIAESMDTKITPLNIPRPVAWIGYNFLEFVGKVLGFQPPLTERVYDWYTENHFFDVSKAQEVLGFDPEYSLEEGMEKTVDWYLEEGWI